MLTVTKLANKFNVSRTTVLYYERVGLLEPALRSDNGYRWYGDKESSRLEKILSFRSFGLSIPQILTLLSLDDKDKQKTVMQHQFIKLEQSIDELRKQQKAIVSFLQQPELLENKMITKERWVEIMKASGLNETDMRNWHINFEKLEPEEHQKFLESLGISDAEIVKIRAI